MGRAAGCRVRPSHLSVLAPLALVALSACSNGGSRHGADATFFGARVITPATAAADLFDDDPRSAALGQPGDVVLANDRIQVIIQAQGRDEGTGPQGGTIIDAGLRRAPGRAHLDAWGELTPMFQLGMTAIVDEVLVERDGGRDGPSVVVARGPAGLLDLVDLQGLLYAEVRGLVDPPLAELLVAIVEDGIPGLLGGIRRLSPRVDVDLTVETRYTLRPGERYVTVETTLINPMAEDFVTAPGDLMDGRGRLEQFVPGTIADSPGFGEPGAITDNLDWLGYFGEDVAYAYVPPRDAVTGEVNSVYVGASGGVAIGTGARRFIEDLVLAPPDLSASDVDPLVVPAGGQASYTRWFVVGEGGVSSVSDVVYDLQGRATGTVRGRVTEVGSGAPLRHVRITALRDGDFGRATTQFLTDADGRFEGRVPAGDYGLVAFQGPTPQDDVRPSILEPVMVRVEAGGEVEQDLSLGAPAWVDVEIWEVTGGKPVPVPGRVSFVGADPTPPTRALMDEGGRGNLAYAEVVMGARAGLRVEPGAYRVVVSRGPEYDTYEEDRTFVPGANPPIVANLTRVVDSTGYLSADLHVHQLRSPDSTLPDEDRIRLFAAEGVDILVATDHDTVSDLNPVLRRLGLTPYLVTLSGEEVSPLTYAHTNVFPLTRSDRNRLGGAIEHTSVKALPPDVRVSGEDRTLADDRDSLTPGQIGEAADALNPGAQVVQLNHPRDTGRNPRANYWTMMRANWFEFGTPAMTDIDPALVRLQPDVIPARPGDLTAMEIQNGRSLARTAIVMNDWFALLHLGERIAGTAVSDIHGYVRGGAGWGRTYVRLDETNHAAINALRPDDRAGWEDHFARRMNAQAASGAFGLFVTAELRDDDAVPSPEARARTGETLSTTTLGGPFDGSATLRVRVQSPPWAPFDRVDVFVSTPAVNNPAATLEVEAPTDLGPEASFTLADGTLVREQVDVGGSFRYESGFDVPILVDRDAWVIVDARGSPGVSGDMFPVDPDADLAHGFTNPIYLDADGNGRYDPAGVGAIRAAAPAMRASEVDPLFAPLSAPDGPTRAELAAMLRAVAGD